MTPINLKHELDLAYLAGSMFGAGPLLLLVIHRHKQELNAVFGSERRALPFYLFVCFSSIYQPKISSGFVLSVPSALNADRQRLVRFRFHFPFVGMGGR